MGDDQQINLTLADSTAPPASAPYDPDQPNIVCFLLDDLGFAQLGCYGSDIDTPNIDRLAQRGLRMTNFHTTAICSPTRACLLTGRNHHRVGMGMLPDLPLPYPGYTGTFPAGAATIAEILRAHGYATTAIGKWHLVPRDQRATGPYHMWPTGVGFDRYYGFLGGETNQWTPNLIRDQHHVEPPATPEDGYHLDADLADEAIRTLRELRLHDPDRPFFCYYATGAPHAPHQAPPEWIERYRGRFDDGWDAWRERTLARQRELGVVPADTELSARPDWVEPWDEIDPDRQRLYARMMEVFAAFLSHTDHHIGRVLDAIDALGETDNTIVVLASDNGTSAEGGPNGTVNQLRHYISDEPDDLEMELARIDDLGGFRSSGHYPWGWALAGNTPFRRWKRYTFEGGVRDPLIVSWPARLGGPGTTRGQYAHAIDVPMTLLDLVGIEPPTELDGIEQMSFDGVALTTALDDPDAPSPRTTQYYECWGSRAIYSHGWKAVTNHVNQLTKAERDHITGSHAFADDAWHLFDTAQDPTESHDLAATHPEKLAELVDLWHREAQRNDVLPIDDSRDNRLTQLSLPWLRFQSSWRLRPGDKVHETNGPMLFGGARIIATFSESLGDRAQGVLCEQGDWNAGWAWFLADGRQTFVLSSDGREQRISAPIGSGQILVVEAVPSGSGALDITFGDGSDTPLDKGRLDDFPMIISPDGAFLTVGYSRPFPVCDGYQPPSPAPDTLVEVLIDAGSPSPLDFDDALAAALRHQ